MELKCNNPNGEIILAQKLNHLEFQVALTTWNSRKIIKIAFRNESYKLFLLGRCSKCLKNKIILNFLITNPIGMNHNFLDRKNI